MSKRRRDLRDSSRTSNQLLNEDHEVLEQRCRELEQQKEDLDQQNRQLNQRCNEAQDRNRALEAQVTALQHGQDHRAKHGAVSLSFTSIQDEAKRIYGSCRRL